jgi:hypothetical protein
MKKIGNYNKSGSELADMLILIWSFKSFARKDEWQYSGYSPESYTRAQEGLKALGLINARGALKPKTKQILSSAGWGQNIVDAALGLL